MRRMRETNFNTHFYQYFFFHFRVCGRSSSSPVVEILKFHSTILFFFRAPRVSWELATISYLNGFARCAIFFILFFCFPTLHISRATRAYVRCLCLRTVSTHRHTATVSHAFVLFTIINCVLFCHFTYVQITFRGMSHSRHRDTQHTPNTMHFFLFIYLFYTFHAKSKKRTKKQNYLLLHQITARRPSLLDECNEL